jgi:hypothetical protein
MVLGNPCSSVPIDDGWRTYHAGPLWGTAVVAVFSRWGKVAAATTATHLISANLTVDVKELHSDHRQPPPNEPLQPTPGRQYDLAGFVVAPATRCG